MTIPSLKVIECTPAHQKYLSAFSNALNNAQSTGKTDLPKIILLSVKYVTTHRYKNKNCIEREEIEQHFQFIELTRQFMMLLTPHQFVNLFPIEKSYDGEKYMVKDYFSTMEMLSHLDMDKPLGGAT